MTSALAPTPSTITDETLIQAFRAYVRKGWTPWLAAEAAVRELCEAGHRDALIREVLPALLFKRWESDEAPARSDTSREVMRGAADQQRRRVNVDVLRSPDSLMEGLFEVGGQWRRIGDMDAATCRRAAREQKRTALEHARYARFFHALADLVPTGRTVREALGHDDLTALYQQAVPR